MGEQLCTTGGVRRCKSRSRETGKKGEGAEKQKEMDDGASQIVRADLDHLGTLGKRSCHDRSTTTRSGLLVERSNNQGRDLGTPKKEKKRTSQRQRETAKERTPEPLRKAPMDGE